VQDKGIDQSGYDAGGVVEAAKAKKVQEIYSSLPKPEKTAKPLSGKKIQKNYRK